MPNVPGYYKLILNQITDGWVEYDLPHDRGAAALRLDGLLDSWRTPLRTFTRWWSKCSVLHLAGAP
jgi:hypothetical protein